jgi:hypothetical protein
MKKEGILSLLFFLIFLVACNSGDGPKIAEKSGADMREPAEISFNEYEHDFGKITEGEKVAHIFTFENKGPGALVINSALTTCGCTVTKYDRNPIPSGKGGSLEVVFDSGGKRGIQTKTITVHSNSKTQVTILKITADVVSDNN